MEQANLFKLKEWKPPPKTCLSCHYRQRWQYEYGSKVTQYCGIRSSGRTHNKLLKIKCKTAACRFYNRGKND